MYEGQILRTLCNIISRLPRKGDFLRDCDFFWSTTTNPKKNPPIQKKISTE